MPSTAEYQSAEFIDHSVLLARLVVGEILLQSLKELALALLLALEAKADEGRDRLAHARVNRLGVPLHLTGQTGSQPDRMT